jgi:hypothetical protein
LIRPGAAGEGVTPGPGGDRLVLITFALALVLLAPAPARAQVELAFYTREAGVRFPHAFVRLQGRLDRDGQSVDRNYGFTVHTISPAVLIGAVPGRVVSVDDAYVRASRRHFAVRLTDEQYARVVKRTEVWRAAPQPSYRLNGRNCVDFVADLAAAAGLDARREPRLMKRPAEYLEALGLRNRGLLSGEARTAAAAHGD